ncbi:MAG: hypothetical protein EOP47_14325 [Sphingobacteriaceae bacterium]|nr:MAG: hypothetical protein EOP47_14325 [Sphingobacteriaceae bacterium]
MKKLFRVDVYSFNVLLGIITPLILCLFIFNYKDSLSAFSYSWLLTTDFLKFIVIILSYSLPLAFFSCKIYQLFKDANTTKFKQLVMIMSSLLFLPFGLALLLIIAKINFVMVIALAVAIFIAYVNSYQFKTCLN